MVYYMRTYHHRRPYGTVTPRQRPHDSGGTSRAPPSQESLGKLAKRYNVHPKTVAKWKKRSHVDDAPMGPKQCHSTVLTLEEEALVVAFRRHTLLPLDDCLLALQATLPRLTRSALHRCVQRHDISRLPDMADEQPGKKKFKAYPIGYFHIDIAEGRTEEGKLSLLVAIDTPVSLPMPSCMEMPIN
jgi:hypothetical protein